MFKELLQHIDDSFSYSHIILPITDSVTSIDIKHIDIGRKKIRHRRICYKSQEISNTAIRYKRIAVFSFFDIIMV